MHFRLEYTISDFWLDLANDDALSFNYGGPNHVTVRLRLPTEKELQIGYTKNNAFGIVESKVEPPDDVRAAFENLAVNKLPKNSKPNDGFSAQYIDPNGNIKDSIVVPLWILPEPFQQFVTKVRTDLFDYVKKTIRLLRWRYDVSNPHNPLSSRGSSWSFDNTQWFPLPTTSKVHGDGIIALVGSPIVQKEIENLLAQEHNEPLGHELYREAWQQRHQNPRSALVLGIAAAETGFKQFVGRIAPDTKWLVENSPSPPLDSMIKNYLPLLPTVLKIDDRVIPPPSEVIKSIKRGLERRNKTIHVGWSAPSYEDLEEILLAVKDFLWMLDYYSGYVWALDHIRPEVKKAFQKDG